VPGVERMMSDDHAGRKAAREARFPGVFWQRCRFHRQQNAGHPAPHVSWRGALAPDLRAILAAPDRAEADRRLRLTVDKDRTSAPQLSAWLEANVPAGLAVFRFPATHPRRRRTSHLRERINKPGKRRTRVATLFPNEAALLRLLRAVLLEIREDGETEPIDLNMENRNSPQQG
jgi:putative transposase